MAGQYGVLPELVRDSRLPAAITQNVTIHTRPPGRRAISRHETWVREQILGHGGYGLVWLERKIKNHDDDSSPELRAVKGIRIPEHQAAWDGKQYVRELEALAKFSQEKFTEFFVKSYGWYLSPGWLHIAMEYCEHGDLKSYLGAVRMLPESQAQEIAVQIVGALASMHECGFAHRDLKPANILIKCKPPEDWWVKLCDFGLSKRHEYIAGASTVRGTPGFMPPETIGFPFWGEPGSADPFAADMWCFGETVFQMLTGRATFENMSDLYRFQSDTMQFPVHTLLRVNASGAAINFICSLMLPIPWQRLRADVAGHHLWLNVDGEPVGSFNQGARGPAYPSEPSPGGVSLSAMDSLTGITSASGQWSATMTQGAPPGGTFYPGASPSQAYASYNYPVQPDLTSGTSNIAPQSMMGRDRLSLNVAARPASDSLEKQRSSMPEFGSSSHQPPPVTDLPRDGHAELLNETGQQRPVVLRPKAPESRKDGSTDNAPMPSLAPSPVSGTTLSPPSTAPGHARSDSQGGAAKPRRNRGKNRTQARKVAGESAGSTAQETQKDIKGSPERNTRGSLEGGKSGGSTSAKGEEDDSERTIKDMMAADAKREPEAADHNNDQRKPDKRGGDQEEKREGRRVTSGPGVSAAAVVEKDVLTSFREFAARQKALAETNRARRHLLSKEEKLNELRQFAASFRLDKPAPEPLYLSVSEVAGTEFKNYAKEHLH